MLGGDARVAHPRATRVVRVRLLPQRPLLAGNSAREQSRRAHCNGGALSPVLLGSIHRRPFSLLLALSFLHFNINERFLPYAGPIVHAGHVGTHTRLGGGRKQRSLGRAELLQKGMRRAKQKSDRSTQRIAEGSQSPRQQVRLIQSAERHRPPRIPLWYDLSRQLYLVSRVVHRNLAVELRNLEVQPRPPPPNLRPAAIVLCVGMPPATRKGVT